MTHVLLGQTYWNFYLSSITFVNALLDKEVILS